MVQRQRPKLGLPAWFGRTGLLLLALTIPVLLFSSQLYVGGLARSAPIQFAPLVLLQFCHWYLWAIAGPVAWALARRWPLSGNHAWLHLAWHAAAAVVVAVCILLGYLVLYHVVTGAPQLKPWFSGFDRSWRMTAIFSFAYLFHLELLVYAAVVIASQAVASTEQLRAREGEALRLASELTHAKLQVLRTQLQPHFLFNTLHTIGSFVLQGRNTQAVETLTELGDVLRLTLDRRDTDQVTLREELAYLRRYLHIEEARFGDRLSVDWRIQTETLDLPVPSFILQPIVENALKHGVSREPGPVRLEIRAVVEGLRLHVSVYNDGQRLPPSWSLERDAGFGLSNVMQRLRHRVPQCNLAMSNVDERGVVAVFDFPGRPKPALGDT
jgi:two-component system LytT family sensor kinase